MHFLSYKFGSSLSELEFILHVSYWIRLQGIETFHYDADHEQGALWTNEINEQLQRATCVVAFVNGLGNSGVQGQEIRAFQDQDKAVIVVEVIRAADAGGVQNAVQIKHDRHGGDARRAARAIVLGSGMTWHCNDGLPLLGKTRPFQLEKQIVAVYGAGLNPKLQHSETGADAVGRGLAIDWPALKERADHTRENPLKETVVGSYQSGKVLVVADDRNDRKLDELLKKGMTFEQAGPRKKVALPRNRDRNANLNAGIVVLGGIAPGINAVIAGIVERHCRYANAGGYARGLKILGFKYGLEGLHNRTSDPLVDISKKTFEVEAMGSVTEHMNEGGAILETSRVFKWPTPPGEEPGLPSEMTPAERGQTLRTLVTRAADADLDVLYVIGGDGGMRAAHAMSNTARALAEDEPGDDQHLAENALAQKLANLAIVGIPKTMDNDILWVWFSFGFQSAVERSTEFVRQLETEATSNPRLCVIQLFGSDSGFVTADAATAASGKCDLFLIPEVKFTMEGIAAYLEEKLRNAAHPHAVVVMAETAVPEDVGDYLGDPADTQLSVVDRQLLERLGLRKGERQALQDYVSKGKLLTGPTPDDLRAGALKVVSRVLEWKLRSKFTSLRMFANEPRHLIRAIPPSSSDITHARRLGYLAVDGAMAGYRDFMVSQWLTEYVMVPLRLVVLGRKRVPISGAFLANARASTGQPLKLT